MTDIAVDAASGPGEWSPLAMLGLAFDEIDYGVMLLDARLQLQFANHLARAELAQSRWLQRDGTRLAACRPSDRMQLDAALADARRGLRSLIGLGPERERLGIAVMPLGACPAPGAVMLTLARSTLCEPLTLHGFARSHGLTEAERRVLEGLCDGEAPEAIARRLGVAISTVRTQLSSIRGKTRCSGTDQLLRAVARQPPLPVRLRQGAKGLGWPLPLPA